MNRLFVLIAVLPFMVGCVRKADLDRMNQRTEELEKVIVKEVAKIRNSKEGKVLTDPPIGTSPSMGEAERIRRAADACKRLEEEAAKVREAAERLEAEAKAHAAARIEPAKKEQRLRNLRNSYAYKQIKRKLDSHEALYEERLDLANTKLVSNRDDQQGGLASEKEVESIKKAYLKETKNWISKLCHLYHINETDFIDAVKLQDD